MSKLDLRAHRPMIISGPCSAETEQQTMDTCTALAASGKIDILRAGIWKPRTSPGGFEGMGIQGLRWMAEAKAQTGLPIAVEVANAKHVESALAFGVDVLWIGARTTVNPFSVQDIADSLRGLDMPVLVKNPMNPDLGLWAGAVERLRKVGIENVGLIHRGFSSFGISQYRNAPMWHLAIEMRRRMPEIPIFCDPSHICGNRELLQGVAQEAADLNYDGLIVESHSCPAQAWSDASQQLTPTDLITMLDSIVWRKEVAEKPEFQQSLDMLRSQIDQFDAEVFSLLGKRMQVAERIGEIKRDNGVMILQAARWDDIVKRILDNSNQLNLSREFLSILLNSIHMESIAHQNSVMNKR
ncbi:MAG: chorismate mutase [Mucinivorans sp.]